MKINRDEIYNQLRDRFSKNGDAIARKGAQLVLDIADGFESRDRIRRNFDRSYHAFIYKCLERLEQDASERERQAEQDAECYRDRLDEALDTLNHYVSAPLSGTEEEQSIARSIRLLAIRKADPFGRARHFAPNVAEGELTIEDAIAAIKKPDSAYWINSKNNW